MRLRAGFPALREAVAAHYGRHYGQELSAEQVCVTSGATEALGAAILATISPGDEVIIFTPAYDSYAPMIRRGGGDSARSSAKAARRGGSSATSSRRRLRAEDPRDHVQQSAQPRRTPVRRRGA